MVMSGLTIPAVAPFPWETTLRYLCYRHTPGLETVAPDAYTRRTSQGLLRITRNGRGLRCSLEAEDLSTRIERLFDPGGEAGGAARVLARCPVVGPHVRALPGLRIPGCWEPVELCLRAILGQQVTVKGAHTLMGRLAALCPEFDPATLAGLDMGAVGLPARRAQTLRTFTERVASGAISFARPWEETAERLREIPGIGPWTVSYLAIRLGRDPDAFPQSDLGLLRASGVATPRELLRLAESWRPYRAYAAMYLWVAPAAGNM
jgi:3-methyladenine DNA glycosylase/8-oxoguanine DNA glycosylase